MSTKLKALILGFWSAIVVTVSMMGFMSAVISTANYFIQIITVIPGIENNNLNGLEAFVAGNPNSIFMR